jgi:hypothetical protein
MMMVDDDSEDMMTMMMTVNMQCMVGGYGSE